MAPIDRLPPEVLSKCFAHIPFHYRLVVTLVSCAWRATALASPEVWTDIDISSTMKSPMSTLDLALSRTGRCPVDLTLYADDAGALDQGTFIDVLGPHMDHIRSIELRGLFWPFEYPAPALESLTMARSRGWYLTENFLGGELGKLRRLHINTVSFPSTCPAVTSVTDLQIDLPAFQGPGGLPELFSLFPHLRALALFGVEAEHVPILRGLSPPSTVSALHLQSVDRNVDLLHLYDAWSDSGHLTDVTVTLYWAPDPETGLRLTSFLLDARELVVERCTTNSMRVVVLDSRARKRTLDLRFVRTDVLVGGFEGAHTAGCLAHLRSLTVSVTLWRALCLRSPTDLPSLKHVTLALDQKQERWIDKADVEVASYLWPWKEIEQLSDFVYSLGLDALTLEMRSWSSSTPPTLQDVEKLVHEHLPVLVQPGGARIRVRGMPCEVVEGLASEVRERLLLAVDWEVGCIVRPSHWG